MSWRDGTGQSIQGDKRRNYQIYRLVNLVGEMMVIDVMLKEAVIRHSRVQIFVPVRSSQGGYDPMQDKETTSRIRESSCYLGYGGHEENVGVGHHPRANALQPQPKDK
ncbi:hypothetical protein TNCV_2933161 [Trichonephila clavipes]|nr:hypothetical protein TNCV_2933161 [Trichonephila clavipes]